MTEFFAKIGEWLQSEPVASTITMVVAWITANGALIGGVIAIIKNFMAKHNPKIDVEKLIQNATDKGVDRLKEISFTQTVQPIAESELKKITETANDYIDKSLKGMDSKINDLIDVLEALSAYFDNSIAVTEEQRTRLNNALKKAKGETVAKAEPPKTVITVKVEEEKKEEPIKEEEPKSNNVVR